MIRVANWWDDLRIWAADHVAISVIVIVAAVCAGLATLIITNEPRSYADRVNAACSGHQGVQDTSYWTSTALCRDGQMVGVPDR